MPVILATQEAKIRRIVVSTEILFQKTYLVEWLKVKSLSSNPRTTKKKKRPMEEPASSILNKRIGVNKEKFGTLSQLNLTGKYDSFCIWSISFFFTSFITSIGWCHLKSTLKKVLFCCFQ
jgi:hypothetical protein